MVYRKFNASRIFDGKQWLGREEVLITKTDGTIVEILEKDLAGEEIETFSGILSPGFVNCHCHLELSHLKDFIPQKTGLVDFVLTIVGQRHFPEEEILDRINNAEQEMIRNGIVAVGDICNNELTIPQKKHRAIVYRNFIEVSGWNPQFAAARFQKSKAILDSFTALLPDDRHQSLVPHAPYSVSDELWALMIPWFNHNTVTIHNQETAWEDELFKTGQGEARRMYDLMKTVNGSFRPSGRSSLQTFLPKLSGADNVLLVHNTFTRQEDINFARSTTGAQSIHWCLCPNANLYIENELPPVQLLRKNKCKIVLGTDSLASNRQLSILEEIKTIRELDPSIPEREILAWATLNGAEALGMQARFGSFDTGKKPGLILLENKDSHQILPDTTVRRIL